MVTRIMDQSTRSETSGKQKKTHRGKNPVISNNHVVNNERNESLEVL